MTDDKRMQVVLGLLPADAVFIVRRGYVVDASREAPCPICYGDCDCPDVERDEDSGTRIDPLLWAPGRNGYVNESNPWQVGLYTEPTGYQPRGVEAEPHSYTVRVTELLDGKALQDGTPLAVLVDEIVRLRTEQDFARVLATLAINGHLCGESTPTPWTAERRDEFSGPNTTHVWQLWDANDNCIDYLSASVDGTAFVAWVNRTATLAISEVVQ